MNEDRYPFLKGLETYSYDFVSEGPNGRIRKVVRYRLLEDSPNIYNLGFGDWDASIDDIDDKVTTNNNDRQKVLATVAQTVVDFIQNNPNAIVFAQGSTPSRTSAYVVFGYLEGEWHLFVKGVNYEAFSLKRK